ncbi:biotin-dependent carboxyltransferase family protein [Arthrobacter sp. HMWF013]|uniref:5-oxoprolinase subunit C family protein n=1 Tax=Arthrobacter sp. HMWF013 TaxID=2056849 RepID=UPI000D332686|nr:biotin-dependent carboxyltransferase family protein [Arthrobacter sp. HMWF013]PTT60981.1 allophanate hydrolase [Arthrobacter sp. HMWF013]
MSGSLIIQQPGNSVVTDLGRFRGPRFGLPVNGALDQFSARAANILTGNDDGAPLLEITALDFRMRATTDILIAVTGAPLHLTVGGRECQQWEPVSVRAGETVALRRMTGGLRAYVAVHGSVEAPVLLGSCAPDTVVGFGLRLTEGTELKTSRSVAPIRQPYFDLPLFRLGLTRPEFSSQAVVEVTDGPDVDEFGDTAELLFTTDYTVSGRSNHIGLRLGGALPERQSSAEVLSRGVPVGAIEVPSREELLVLHRGRGVTAGYPVLAVVTSRSLDVLAQARPGHTLTFRKTTVPDATAKHRAALRELENLRSTVSTVFALLGIGSRPGWSQLAPAAGT